MENINEELVPLKGLYLEDSPEDMELVTELLAGEAKNVALDRAADEKEFRAALAARPYDVILTDFRVSGFDGFASLRLASELRPGVPVICISGAIGEETAVDLLKAGAVDYILKDRLARLPAAIRRAVSEAAEKKARRQAAEALRQAKEEMENFLYITSHDLRSPLVNIQGFSQNLQKDCKALREVLGPAALPGEIREAVDRLSGKNIPASLDFIIQSVMQMDKVINSVLKVSRAGRVEMKPEVLDVNAVVKNILTNMRFHLEEAGGVVKTGGLPACKADPDAMRNIFSNLLWNAVKYRAGDRRLEISLRGERNSAGTAVYVVSDNGRGIKAAALPAIWRLFSGNRARASESGEGIGLAMCRVLAEKNGGKVWAESKEGEGSAFFVEMPAAER